MRTGTCKHFNGTHHNKACRAGVVYDDVTTEPNRLEGKGIRIPCHQMCTWTNKTQIAEFEKRGTCDKYEEPTRAEIAAYRKDMEAAFYRVMKAGPLIEKVKREHRGTNWTGVEKCPACGGNLHMSHAESNGHVWGKCETDNCMSWME